MIPHYISENNAPVLVCAGASDILIGGDVLTSTKNPPIGDFIISKKRTAIATFQPDGNFVVYVGFFNTNGQATGKASPIYGSTNATNTWDIFKNTPGPYKMVFDQGITIMDSSGKVLNTVLKLPEYMPGAQLMTLGDDGNLIYSINGVPVWSLFPTGAPTTTTPGQADAILNPPSGLNNLLLPIGAALAGLYFFLKK
jgi:hypothetical protein